MRTKRVKQVYKNVYELAHVFAAQTQERGRLPSANGRGNFGSQGHFGPRAYFEGTRFYSYGSHYLAAQIHGPAVLVNTYKASNTTGTHLAAIKDAFRDRLHVFEVPYPSQPAEPGNTEYLANQVADHMDQILRQRHDGATVDGLLTLIREHNCYIETYSLAAAPIILDKYTLELLTQLVAVAKVKRVAGEKVRTAKFKARYEALRIERERAEAELKSNVRAWKAGKLESTAIVGYRSKFDLIRVEGLEVVTHRGARVPLAAAKALLSNLSVGAGVGEFTVDAIDGDTVKIGCHKFSISAAKKVLGVL